VKTLERIPVRSPASVAVFRHILSHGPLGRVDVARATHLSAAAVTKAVTPLIATGFVVESVGPRAVTTVGRPVNPLVVSPDRASIVGVKITPEASYGILTDLAGGEVATTQIKHDSSRVDDVLAAVNEIVSRLRTSARNGIVDGLGVTASGDIDRLTGIVRSSHRLGWSQVPLKKLLEAETGLPVTIDNDVRALTTLEWLFGAGRNAESLAVVTIGAGIGCGLILNGGVVRGAHGVSGEIGHLPLARNDLTCSCGRSGCVETIASTSAILGAVRGAGHDEIGTIEDASRLALEGDAAATHAFAEAGRVIGAALATLANLVGPQTIIIAGEGVTEYDLYARHLRDEFSSHAFGAALDCEIILKPHTFNDWARGAAVSVIEEIASGTS